MSLKKITFLDDILLSEKSSIFYLYQAGIAKLSYCDSGDIFFSFLNGLTQNKTYVVCPELVYSSVFYQIGDPVIILSKPFLVTKESNADIVSKFIIERVVSAWNFYKLDNIPFVEQDGQIAGPAVLFRYKEITLFN